MQAKAATRLQGVLGSCLAAWLTAGAFAGGACGGKPDTTAQTTAGTGGSAATDAGAGRGGAASGSGGIGSGGTTGLGAGGEAGNGGTSTGGAGGDAGSGGVTTGGASGATATGGTSGNGGGTGAGGVVSDGSAGASGTAGTGGSGGSGGGPSSVPKAGTIPIVRPEPSGCINDVGPGKLVFTGCAPSTDWSFHVSVPPQCLEKACGLIFDAHGGPGTFSAAIQEAGTRLAELGEKESYIVVQPDSPIGIWGNPRDPLMASFLRLAMDVWNVEERRVHFTGFNIGAELAFRMGCLLHDVLASIAPVSPGTLEGFAAPRSICPAGTPPVDTLWIRSRHEALMLPERQEEVLQQLIAEHSLVLDRVLAEDANHTWKRYTNSQGHVLESLQHGYRSNDMFYGACYLQFYSSNGRFRCSTGAPELSHGQIVLDFFLAHPRWR